MGWLVGQRWAGPQGRVERGRFFEKNAQAGRLGKKLLIPPVFERPCYGGSKTGGIKSCFGYFFFKKSNCFLPS
jgi:hypothetical protein